VLSSPEEKLMLEVGEREEERVEVEEREKVGEKRVVV
jgi:hypothetical protein